MQRALRFGTAVAQRDFDQTFRSGHPGVTVMWLGVLAVGPKGLAPFLAGPFPDFRTFWRSDVLTFRRSDPPTF